jgi:hypothetical protein
MTHKVIILEFVVPTVLAIALGIVLSIGAVYLIDNYLVPIDQAEAYHSAAEPLIAVWNPCAVLKVAMQREICLFPIGRPSPF